LDIETTAYNPPDVYFPEGVAAPLTSPEAELPRIELTRAIDFVPPDDVSPSPVAPASELELELEQEPELELEPKLEPELELGLEPGLEPGLNPERETELELEPELKLVTGWEPKLLAEPEPEVMSDPEPELELDLDQELESELELEPGLVTEFEPAVKTELEPEMKAEPEPAPDIGLVLDLGSELEPYESAPPAIDPTQQARLEPPVEEYEDISLEEEPATADVGRGVFDTETLASIYTSQGFYGRAAEIYQRLLAQRPEDLGLRGKLEGVLALDRKESGLEEPIAAVVAAPSRFASPAPLAPAAVPAGAMPTGPDRTISQLNTLLEAFKGGRPR
jgi:hypothetical protein